MHISCVASFLLICFVQGSHSLKYSDVEDLGISCPMEHICDGIQNNSEEFERACECDLTCDAYGDCCIGAGRQGYWSEGAGTQRHIPARVGRARYGPEWARRQRYKPAWVKRQRHRPARRERQRYRSAWVERQRYRPAWRERQRYRPAWVERQIYNPVWSETQRYNPIWAETERYWPAHAKRENSIQAASTGVECFKYGGIDDPAIYAVSKCNRKWNGPIEVKQKCEGFTDISDPFTAVPVTSTSRAVTYKNLHCAECNNADLESLRPFLYGVWCENLGDRLDDMSDEQFMDQLSYDEEGEMWILKRRIDERISYNIECGIKFVMPDDLKNQVRFCRANIISECAPDWNQPEVAKLCDEYMAVVYHFGRAFRNPHCAICNYRAVWELSCTTTRTIGFGGAGIAFSRLIDLNYKSSPSCKSGQNYDPFAKKCRTLRCAFPGYVVIEDKCVPGE